MHNVEPLMRDFPVSNATVYRYPGGGGPDHVDATGQSHPYMHFLGVARTPCLAHCPPLVFGIMCNIYLLDDRMGREGDRGYTTEDHDEEYSRGSVKRSGSLYDVDLGDVVEGMPGNSYQIEHITWEGYGKGKRPTTFSVYVYPTVDHQYEVGRWLNGKLKDTAIVTYDTHTCGFTCTCRNAREKSRAMAVKRGWCDHVEELAKHNARKLPTLPAPAAQVQEQFKEVKSWTDSSLSSTVRAVSKVPSALRALTSRDLSTAQTVSVTYMPATAAPPNRR